MVDAAWTTLLGVIAELPSTRSFADIMSAILAAARKLCQADGITFVRREGDLCYYEDEDAISPLWKGKRFPMSACISGWCMLNRKTAVITDIYKDPRIPHDAYRPTFVKSLVMVPVRIADPIAAIGTYWSEERIPTTHTVTMLEALAQSTATAIMNAEKREARFRGK